MSKTRRGLVFVPAILAICCPVRAEDVMAEGRDVYTVGIRFALDGAGVAAPRLTLGFGEHAASAAVIRPEAPAQAGLPLSCAPEATQQQCNAWGITAMLIYIGGGYAIYKALD